MSNELHISNKVRNGMVEGAANSIEQGSDAVKALIYSAGSGIPSNHNVGITDQVLLAEHASNSSNDGFEDTGALGSLSARAFGDVAIVADGQPAFFRLLDANNEVCMQGTCGASGAHMIVSKNDYKVNEISQITQFDLSVPATSPAAS